MGISSLPSLPLSIDWIIIGVIALLIAADAMRTGPARAAALGLALPVALQLYETASQSAYLGTILRSLTASSSFADAGIFAAVFVLSYLFSYRMVASFGDDGGFARGIVAGVAGAVILVIFWMQVPALGQLWTFGAPVSKVFAESYRFWWLLGAYAALAFARS